MVYTFTFTQGFILGQLTVVLLIGAFIKFFVFGELPPQESSSSRLSSTNIPSSPSKQRRRSLTSTTSSIHHRPRRRAVSFTSPASPSPSPSRRNSDSDSSIHNRPRDRSRNRTSIHHILRPPPALTSETILSKTYYNVSSHQSESLDWFNVLIAQTIAQFRADAARDNAILNSLTRVLNGVHKPSFLDEIRVTEIELGEYFPIFSNCRIVPVFDEDEDDDEVIVDKKGKSRKKGKGRLQAQMDVDISDFITLGIETMMVLNYPRPRTAVLPVALSVSVVRFSGTLAISFSPATSTSSTTESGTQSRRTPTTLAFSFLPDYTLALSTRSLVGARSRLQDIPKIAQLVESRLRMWFEERCVLPRRQEVVVPSLWPSMKNVVDGEGKKPGQTPLMSAVAESEVEIVPSEFRNELENGEMRWRGGGDKKREVSMNANSSGLLPGPLPGSLVT